MINVDKVDDGLPISVIVPLSKHRTNFFYNYVYPLLEANNPMEIIVNDNDGLAPKKRNDGYKKSTQPYVFFVDDDILLPADHLEKLYNELLNNEFRSDKKIGYTYSGYKGIVMYPNTHPMKGNFDISTRKFNAEQLKKGNYISTMALINRKHFPMFDESLKRLQDWDVWLTMLKNGIYGKEVYDNEFFAYYLDQGITSNNNNERDAMLRIINKHKLGTW